MHTNWRFFSNKSRYHKQKIHCKNLIIPQYTPNHSLTSEKDWLLCLPHPFYKPLASNTWVACWVSIPFQICSFYYFKGTESLPALLHKYIFLADVSQTYTWGENLFDCFVSSRRATTSTLRGRASELPEDEECFSYTAELGSLKVHTSVNKPAQTLLSKLCSGDKRASLALLCNSALAIISLIQLPKANDRNYTGCDTEAQGNHHTMKIHCRNPHLHWWAWCTAMWVIFFFPPSILALSQFFKVKPGELFS